jgi:hypothetical protein
VHFPRHHLERRVVKRHDAQECLGNPLHGQHGNGRFSQQENS